LSKGHNFFGGVALGLSIGLGQNALGVAALAVSLGIWIHGRLREPKHGD